MIKAIVTKGEDGYFVGECEDIPVVTQGFSVKETVSNLKEAIDLYFEDELHPFSEDQKKLNLKIKI
ncbi:MAG: type II toxin-antitoxin system HicB family antitoxin [Ignavibacteria bacterium]|nr:type II toxin-antitoxin system HicB family antitoxin [Ignavibacteria bacterium]